MWYQIRNSKNEVLQKGFRGLEGLKKAREIAKQLAKQNHEDISVWSNAPVEKSRGEYIYLGYNPITSYLYMENENEN